MTRLACLGLVVACVACAPSGPRERHAGSIAYDANDLMAYPDTARGVVCYRVLGISGFSCAATPQPRATGAPK